MDNDMFSGSTSLLRPVTRQAEETDTHMYIRQQERDQNRKRFTKSDDDDSGFDMNDQTSVSLDALATFLSNMLGDPQPAAMAAQNAAAQERAAPAPRANLVNRRAASAYAHAAETAPHPPLSAESALPESTIAAEAEADAANAATEGADRPDANNDLLRTILQDVEFLRKGGVQTITIERAETFEQSLIEALERAKNALLAAGA